VKTTADVELLRWPGDPVRRTECAERGIPCLLLVEQGFPPPDSVQPLEDWIRVPADEHDLLARVQHLGALAARSGSIVDIDDSGILTVGDTWVALSPTETALAQRLAADAGRLVSRRDLLETIGRAGERRSRTLDLQVHRLRRRVAAVGLTITAVRGRGYVLEIAASERNPRG
jgi:two-component system OmpR family response regulator